MASTNDESFIAFCNDLRAYVEEHHLFPNKHTKMLSRVKYIRKKIKAGTLKGWQKEMFLEIADMRDLTIHTGGRRRK